LKNLVSICVALLSLAIPAIAADPAPAAKPQLFLIHEEVARPSKLMQYESTTNELLAAITEKKGDPKIFGMNLYTTTEFHYVFVVPIANWAAIDTFQANWTALGESIGKEKWASLMKRNNETMESYNEFVVVRRPDLSYEPVTPRVKPEEQRFVHWAFYYLDPARAEESEQIARDYAALFKSKNIGDGFTVYQAVSGNDMPLLVVGVPAKNAADFYTEDAKVNATFGADIAPLAMRAMAITRKYRTMDAVYRPEMSYPAAK
jgi:hypothetical protein